MNVLPQGQPARALWLMFAISGAWVIYLFGTHYGSCRLNGTDQVACFVIALFLSWLEVLVFVFGTIVKLIMFILP
jgi:hypothetical protein